MAHATVELDRFVFALRKAFPLRADKLSPTKTGDDVPIELVTYTPQIITLLVLALASQRLRMPAADGIPWRKGQGT